MFKFSSRDIITLFHQANSPASIRVANLLKQASANATEYANQGASGDRPTLSTPRCAEFELNITEGTPTTSQLKTILDYVGIKGIPHVIEGAYSVQEALKLYGRREEYLQRPLTVDWNNGKVVFHDDDESKILKMLQELPRR